MMSIKCYGDPCLKNKSSTALHCFFSLYSIQQRDDQLSLGGFPQKGNWVIQCVSVYEGNSLLGVSYAEFETAAIEVWSIM